MSTNIKLGALNQIIERRKTKMASMTALAQTMAMPTTQLTRVVQYEDAASWQLERTTERASLRMRWVVVTDNDGKRQLRMQWS
jgi:hypothetical protein